MSNIKFRGEWGGMALWSNGRTTGNHGTVIMLVTRNVILLRFSLWKWRIIGRLPCVLKRLPDALGVLSIWQHLLFWLANSSGLHLETRPSFPPSSDRSKGCNKCSVFSKVLYGVRFCAQFHHPAPWSVLCCWSPGKWRVVTTITVIFSISTEEITC